MSEMKCKWCERRLRYGNGHYRAFSGSTPYHCPENPDGGSHEAVTTMSPPTTEDAALQNAESVLEAEWHASSPEISFKSWLIETLWVARGSVKTSTKGV